MAIDVSYITDYNTAWNTLISGNIPTAVISPFTQMFGSYFYVLMAFTAMMMIYFKWNDFTSTLLVGMVILAGLLPFLYAAGGVDNIYPLIFALCALGITMILYKLFYKGG